VKSLDFPTFFRDTAPPLLAYLRRLGATEALAEDVAQDAFATLVAKGGLRWKPDHARAYAYRVATNGYVDACRRRRREMAWDVLPDVADPSTESPTHGLDASPAWRALSARQRQLLWLAYAEGFTHAEIASICRLAERSVRVLLFRAREAFKAATEAAS
jgi:RNA polymerase sigma-70 factor (ECF subfamily)